jgi:hypothetical protein
MNTYLSLVLSLITVLLGIFIVKGQAPVGQAVRAE